MSSFNLSTFTNQLKLPLVGAAAVGVTDTAAALTKNFANPRPQEKIAEGIQKVAENGIAGNFDAISKDVVIEQGNGSILAVDSASNEPIAKVGEYEEQGVPTELIENQNSSSYFRVSIRQVPAIGKVNEVIFDVMPQITEQRSASYDSAQILHHPGEILKFKSTSARTWQISATLISRTPAEASGNLVYVNLMRSWLMPFYGVGTEQTLGNYLGAPPPILILSGYGDKMIGETKCVLESYNWSWDNDIDYIPTLDLTPFPVIVKISLTLKESFSPAEYSSFDLMAYREGNVMSAFTSRMMYTQQPNTDRQPIVPQQEVTTSEPARLTSSQAQTKVQKPDIQQSAPSTGLGGTFDYPHP
jgi:hypothetical protein